MLEQAGGWGTIVGVILAAIGVIGYWRGTVAKTALATYKESNDAYRDRIDQLREDVDALKAENFQLRSEINTIKQLPLAAIKTNQEMALKLLDQIQTTQTDLLKILANQSATTHVEVTR